MFLWRQDSPLQSTRLQRQLTTTIFLSRDTNNDNQPVTNQDLSRLVSSSQFAATTTRKKTQRKAYIRRSTERLVSLFQALDDALPCNIEEVPIWLREFIKLGSNSQFNLISASRSLYLLVKLARISTQHEQAVKQFLKSSDFRFRWLIRTETLLSEFVTDSQSSSRTLASLVHSLGVLQLMPPPSFLKVWIRASNQFEFFSAQSLSNVIWAFQRLNYVLPDQENQITRWFASFRAEIEPEFDDANQELDVLDTEEVEARGRYLATEMTCALWIRASLDLPLVDLSSFLDLWTKAFQTYAKFFSSVQLENSLWAFSQLSIDPGEHVLEIWNDGFEREILSFGAAQLQSVLYSFAKLRIYPGDEFLEKWFGSFVLHLSSFTSQSLANTIWSIARLDITVRKDFWNHWLYQFGVKSNYLNPSEYSMSIWALGKLKLNSMITNKQALQDLVERCFLRLASPPADAGDVHRPKAYVWTAQQLANVLYGATRLDMDLSEEFIDAWLCEAAQISSTFHPSAFATSLVALTKLHMHDSHFKQGTSKLPDFVRAFYDSFDRDWTEYKAIESSNAFWATFRLDPEPRASFVRTFDQSFQRNGTGYHTIELISVMDTVCRYRVVMSEIFYSLWMSTLEPHLGSLTFSELESTMHSLSMLLYNKTYTVRPLAEFQEKLTIRFNQVHDMMSHAHLIRFYRDYTYVFCSEDSVLDSDSNLFVEVFKRAVGKRWHGLSADLRDEIQNLGFDLNVS